MIIEKERPELFQKADELAVAITFADPSQQDCPLIHCNPEFERLTGFSNADVVGQNCRFLQGEGTDRDEVSKLGNAVQSLRTHTATILNYKSDGSRFDNLCFIAPLKLNTKDLIFLGCQFQFDAQTTSKEVMQHNRDWLDLTRRFTKARTPRAVDVQDRLTMRSEASLMRIKDYLSRRRIGDFG